MKTLISMLILLIGSLTCFAQTIDPVFERGKVDTKLERNSGFDKLSFEVELNKKSYLPFEPLFVKFKVSNQTQITLAADRPEFLLHLLLKVVNPSGETREVTGLSLSSGGGVSLPGPVPVLNPNQSYEEEKVPAVNPNVFAETGNYQIQFFLYGLQSNVIEITIETPQGNDKKAFDFLNKHGKDVWFGNIFQEKNGLNLMTTFVNKYSESRYGEYAIASLGLYYYSNREFDKAKVELEKLLSIQNNYIAKQSKELLKNIEKEQTKMQEQEQKQQN